MRVRTDACTQTHTTRRNVNGKRMLPESFFNQRHSRPNKTLNTLPEREVFSLRHSKRAHLLAGPVHLCVGQQRAEPGKASKN